MPRLVDADEFEKRCMFSKEVYKKVDDDGLYAVLEELRMTPTIDAEPVKHGHWARYLDTRFGRKLNDTIRCSCCGITFSTEDMIRRSYCPNCGAKMDEVTDNA